MTVGRDFFDRFGPKLAFIGVVGNVRLWRGRKIMRAEGRAKSMSPRWPEGRRTGGPSFHIRVCPFPSRTFI